MSALLDLAQRGVRAARGDGVRPSPFAVGRAADHATVVGVFLSTASSLEVGSITAADVLLGAAVGLRLLQLCGPGLRLAELGRHAVLLSVVAVFSLGGVLSGVANGDPLQWDFIRAVMSTLGSVFLVAAYATDEARLQRLIQVFGLSGVALAASGLLLEGQGAHGRATGLTLHPNVLGHSTLMGIAAAVYLFERAPTQNQRRFWAAGALLGVWALMSSGSRGSFLGLAVGALLYVVLSGNHRAALAAVGTAYAALVLSVSGVVELPETNPLTRLTSSGTATAGANEQRAEALDQALERIREDPVFGHGFEGSLVIHVVYLQGWVGAGVLGMAALTAVGAISLALPFTQRRRNLALAVGAAAVAVAWLFTNILSFRDQWIFLALAFRATDSPLRWLADRR